MSDFDEDVSDVGSLGGAAREQSLEGWSDDEEATETRAVRRQSKKDKKASKKSKKDKKGKSQSAGKKTRKTRVSDADESEDEPWSDEADDGPDLENPENYVRHVLGGLLTWRQPLYSGLCLSLVILTYGLLHVSEYGIVTLVSFLVMFQLAATTVAMRFSPELKESGVVSKHFDAERFAAQRQIVSVRDITMVSRGLSVMAGDAVDLWEMLLVEEEDNVKVAVVLLALTLVALSGFFMQAYVLLFGLIISAFAFVPLYSQNKEAIDEAVQQGWEQLDMVLNP